METKTLIQSNEHESTYLVLLASAHGTRQSSSWYALHW